MSAFLSAARLLSIGAKQRSIVVLGAFFDDSGTHDDAPFVAIGGLLGTENQWEYFNKRWLSQLEEPAPGKSRVKQFHLNDCKYPCGDFKNYTLNEREYAIGRFRDIILDVGLITIAAAVDLAVWRELVTGQVAEELGNPIGLCFYKCVEATFNAIRWRRPGEQIVFMFDQGTQDKLDMWTRLFSLQKDKFPELNAMGFLEVEKNPPLQGADYIAYNTYQFAQSSFALGSSAVPDPIFSCFMKRELSCGLIFGREQISEIVERVNITLASRS